MRGRVMAREQAWRVACKAPKGQPSGVERRKVRPLPGWFWWWVKWFS